VCVCFSFLFNSFFFIFKGGGSKVDRYSRVVMLIHGCIRNLGTVELFSRPGIVYSDIV